MRRNSEAVSEESNNTEEVPKERSEEFPGDDILRRSSNSREQMLEIPSDASESPPIQDMQLLDASGKRMGASGEVTTVLINILPLDVIQAELPEILVEVDLENDENKVDLNILNYFYPF